VSVFITLICWRLTSIENINGFLNFCIYVIFYFSAGISISTILPIQTSKLTYTKSQTINSDGYLILQLLKYSRLPKEYRKSYELIEDKDFANAISLLDGLINKGYTKVHAYRLAVVANIHGKDYIKADKLNKIIKNNFQFNADDYCNAGFINIQNGNIEEGISNCRKSLELNPNHSYSLNNIGYCLGLAGRYEEAINYLNSVIAIAPAFAHPYNNRGFAKLKMGNFEDALLDINHSIQLDDKNAYAYLNLGIYYLSKDELEEAGCLFEKALSIEKDIHVPEEYLLQVKQQRIP
jgi:tetratricopeptide (TPR) repeat protein